MNKYDKFREKVKTDRYSGFVCTLQQCGSFLLNASDEIIETNIFEEFDIGIRSDACDENLELFVDEGWINEEIKDKCLKLRNLFLNIYDNQPQIPSIQEVRTSQSWREIFELSDEIKRMIYNDRFVFTLQRCGVSLLNVPDETVEEYIFMDFDLGITGNDCDVNLELFVGEGWINEDIRDSFLKLRSLYLNIYGNQPRLCNARAIKTSPVWREVLELSDKIKLMLYK